jgi:hypothetical protein
MHAHARTHARTHAQVLINRMAHSTSGTLAAQWAGAPVNSTHGSCRWNGGDALTMRDIYRVLQEHTPARTDGWTGRKAHACTHAHGYEHAYAHNHLCAADAYGLRHAHPPTSV